MKNLESQARHRQAPFDARRAILTSLCALVAACSADAVSIGAGDLTSGSGQKPECRSDVSASVTTTNQQEIDALAGCEEIFGDLSIHPFRGMDLRPLRWLRVVHAGLTVGSSFGVVESLEGLEAVERLNSLWLIDVEVKDLSSLASLTIVASDANAENPFPGDGFIQIDGCNQLRDLSGLAQLSVWNELIIENSSNLESLNGLYVGRRTGLVYLASLPKLRDLTALASAQRIESLTIVSTGLEDLDGLDGVENIGELDVVFNPNLRSLENLSGLAFLQEMFVTDNAVLEQLPQPPGLRGLGRLQIMNNPELRSVPRYDGNLGVLEVGTDEPRDTLDVGFQSFEIAGNSKLSEIALPTNHTSGQNVSIHDNQALTDLDLGGLRSVDTLEIRDNASLSRLALGELARVDELTVVNNPRLSTGVFDSVQTFTRDMSGNLSGAGAAPPP